MEPTVRRKIAEARRRLMAGEFLAGLAWALVWAAGLVVAAYALTVWRLAVPAGVLIVLTAVPVLVLVVRVIVRWRSDLAVARALDAGLSTKDRFVTCLALPGSDWKTAVESESARFAAGLSLRGFGRTAAWRPLVWLVIPLLLVGGLEAWRLHRRALVAEEAAAARELLKQAREAARSQPPEVQQAVAELAEVERALPDSEEPLRDALRALNDLERRLAEGSAGTSALTPAEAAALAEAVAESSPALAGALRSGDREAAAQAISQMSDAELARALEQAARHTASKRLQELARQQDGGRQQLQAMVRMVPGSGGENGRKFLASLRDVKNGTGQQSPGDQPSVEGLPGENPPGNEKSPPGRSDDAPPGGNAGNERDEGRGRDVAGENDPTRESPGGEEFLAGQWGDGATLVELFRAAGGDDPTARRTWKAAHQSATAAALDAVEREEIPAGSRLLVRRYFESLRPKDP